MPADHERLDQSEESNREGNAIFSEMKTFWELIEWRAAQSSDALAVRDDLGWELTYSELRDAVEQMAFRLAARGVSAGHVVSWLLPSKVETMVVFSALTRIGAVQNPIVPIFGEREVEFITSQVGTRMLITPGVFRNIDFTAMGRSIASRGGFDVVEIADLRSGPEQAVPAPEDGDAVRWIFSTSGTTASPKCVQHSDRTILAASRALLPVGFHSGGRWGGAVPISHSGGPTVLGSALLAGASMSVVEVFHPITTCERLRDWDCDLVAGVGALVSAMFEFQRGRSDRAFPSLRCLASGGGPKLPGLLERTRNELGTELVPSYGMTECPYISVASIDDPIEVRAEGEGTAPPGVDIRIVDENERDLGAGQEGEIRVRGPQLFLGYVDSSLDGPAFDDKGFFKTGDLGYLAPQGHLVVTGRLKEMVVRNGENLSTRPIEDLLLQHPAVSDSTVIGMPHPVTGECVCAVVVPVSGSELNLEEIRSFCSDHGLMRQKLPERLEVVDAIPRNPMGKAIKPELKRRFIEEDKSRVEPHE